MLLSDGMIAQQARQAGLEVRNNHHFGQDYARTCQIWADRLTARKARIHEQGFDEKFFRIWQYYLEICAASFAVGQTSVTQVELAHAA
jgi:cyclopropane-fatty-acyl-phospholipid synthase